MAYILRTRTLFISLSAVYILTLFLIMSKLNYDQTLSQNLMIKEIEQRHKSHVENIYVNRTFEIIRNITRTVYVNRTLLRYVDRNPVVYGPGENGTKVELQKSALSDEILNKTETNRMLHGFDTIVSDAISLHRKLPDVRPPACREIVYPDSLPPISVVIIFRDEWPSILLRTAYSVLENSPPELVKEVILVDDGSLSEDLRIKVDIHVASVGKFRLVRHREALGLMLARQRGIEATTAKYIVVMDGHMEVTPGWLEPLLFRLTQQPRALLCSHVGIIYQDNFGFFVDKEKPEEQVFDQQFPFFDPLTLNQAWVFYKDSFRQVRNHSVAPLEYGTIQGMMAAMRKDFFMSLGGFDPGMKIWGAEQIELSVKVWMCGGRVEMIPCSKAGHMYR